MQFLPKSAGFDRNSQLNGLFLPANPAQSSLTGTRRSLPQPAQFIFSMELVLIVGIARAGSADGCSDGAEDLVAMASAQTKRVAVQKQAAAKVATKHYARQFESGDMANYYASKIRSGINNWHKFSNGIRVRVGIRSEWLRLKGEGFGGFGSRPEMGSLDLRRKVGADEIRVQKVRTG